MEEEKFLNDDISDNPDMLGDGNDDPSADYEVAAPEIIKSQQPAEQQTPLKKKKRNFLNKGSIKKDG